MMTLRGDWSRSPNVVIGKPKVRLAERYHCFMGERNIGHVWAIGNRNLKAWMAWSSFAGKLTIEGSAIDPPYATMEQAQTAVERYAEEVYKSLASVFRADKEI